jgi:putative transposase
MLYIQYRALETLSGAHALRGYTSLTLRVHQFLNKKQEKMARSRYKFLTEDSYPYFITATTVNWLPLFSDQGVASILLGSLHYLVECQQITLFAYVIMENHLHLIAAASDLSGEIAKFKSFTARKSIDYYLEHNHQFILDQLAFYKLKHKADRTYQFWQEGSHPQRIENESMMNQKLAYIHNNPVRRGYVDLPEHWRYSSARNYAGVEGLVPVMIEW